jgi:aspartyl/asparaginyl beta-hydroxylase (cupin superfamily)
MAYSDPTATDWVDTPLLESCRAIQRVLARLECPIKSTRLMRLAAGAQILEHTDHELGYEDGEVRLHIPVVTSSDVEFWLNSRRVEMWPGELWYLNVNLPHRVANRSSQDRTHLVIDCEVNEWIRALFRPRNWPVNRPT